MDRLANCIARVVTTINALVIHYHQLSSVADQRHVVAEGNLPCHVGIANLGRSAQAKELDVFGVNEVVLIRHCNPWSDSGQMQEYLRRLGMEAQEIGAVVPVVLVIAVLERYTPLAAVVARSDITATRHAEARSQE
ncbi:hypothetical protein FQZ97_971990 [compost metagenome]